MYLSVKHYANTIYVVEMCVAKLLGKQEDGTKWMHPRETITVRDIPCLTASRKPPTQRDLGCYMRFWYLLFINEQGMLW